MSGTDDLQGADAGASRSSLAITDPGAASSPGSGASGAPLGDLRFNRRFVLPAAVLGAAELIFIVYPLAVGFDLAGFGADTLLRTVLPVAVGAVVVWLAAITAWLMPLWSAVAARRRGERVHKELAARAYRITLNGPVRVLLLRTGLWSASAALVGLFLHVFRDWPIERVAEITALAAIHAYILSCIRAVWWAQTLGKLSARLFAAGSPLKRFDDSHFRQFTLVAMIVVGGVLAAQAAFAYYFVPITFPQYLQFETYVAVASAVGVTAWLVVARLSTRDLRRYLAASRNETVTGAPPAAVIYRRGQALPYRLAVLTIAGAIYEQLWHRDVLRPLLAHLTQRYRVPVRSIAPSLSLRSKLLLSFGGVVLLACGMALLWGFVQYKRQATESVERQSQIGLSWLRSELQTEIGGAPSEPTPQMVAASLHRITNAEPK